MGVLGGGFDYHLSYFYTSHAWGEQLLHAEGKRKSGRRQTTGKGSLRKETRFLYAISGFP